jgi:hypothetical protein
MALSRFAFFVRMRLYQTVFSIIYNVTTVSKETFGPTVALIKITSLPI